jgi:hypothetical protein
MNTANNIRPEEIFGVDSESEFNRLALRIFDYQYIHCLPYRQFCEYLNVNRNTIEHYSQLPFLPIQFFKSTEVVCDIGQPVEKTFLSSGTTATGRSQHNVIDLSWYEQSFMKGFSHFYGNPEEFTFIALLPSYLEQGDSSLVYMVHHLIQKSADKRSGFYEVNESLSHVLYQLEQERKTAIIIGVTYALLDLVERFPGLHIPSLIVMETGGMKGRRKELPKEELHRLLKDGLKVAAVHSEYGMTEMLSQGYSKGNAVFQLPPWVRVLIRESNDPMGIHLYTQKTGGINIVDLANVNSCSFIATQDLGKMDGKGLQIMGRFDHSDTRGCNLLMDLNK